jgi:hypothetical protein
MDQESNIVDIKKEKSKKDLRVINWIQGITILIAIAALIISFISYTNSAGNFEIENRAYVYIQSIYPSNIYEHFFELKFKNYGKTPAKEIKVTEVRIDSIEIRNLNKSLKVDSTEFAIVVSDKEQSIRIPANTAYYSIAEKHGKVFFVGKIIYKDIFDEEHQTQYAGWLRAHGENTFFRLQGSLNISD